MKRWAMVILVLAFVPFMWGCAEEKKAEKAPVPEKKVQEDVKPVTPPAIDWAKHKEEFEKKARATLDELAQKTEELKDKIATAGAETKDKLIEQYKELTEKKGALNKKLDELKTATAETWEKIKAEIETGMENLQNALKKGRNLERKTVAVSWLSQNFLMVVLAALLLISVTAS